MVGRRWWGDGGCEAARCSATVAAASRKCEPRAVGGQSRAGAVTAAGVRWCCEGTLGVGGGWGCLGPVLSWSRDGGNVVGGFGAHGAALASAFEDSMVGRRWWGDGDREAARRSAAVAAASAKCEPPAAGGFSHDANSRLRVMSL